MIRVDRGYEIYVFPNGNSAYKRFKVYKVYESKDAAINAIKIYLRTEVVGRTGIQIQINSTAAFITVGLSSMYRCVAVNQFFQLLEQPSTSSNYPVVHEQ